MSKNKKDRSGKKYVPRGRDTLKLKFEPWRLKLVFDPLTAILDQLEQEHTLTVSASGAAMFKDATDGDWYDSAAALRGVIEAYEIFERRRSIDVQLEPLRVLATKIEQGQEIDNYDTTAARSSVHRIHVVSMEMTIGEARELINDFNIREALSEL